MSYSEAMAKHYYLKEFADKLDSLDCNNKVTT